jgi:signal transduction histidine kinase
MGVAISQKAVPLRETSLIAALSELAARVQRERTVDAVLATAGRGALELGMRLVNFEFARRDLVLRYIATAPSRLEAIERQIGRPLRGLRAPRANWDLIEEVVANRRTIYREDLNLFDRFLRRATSYDATPLDAVPETAGITNGVLAPLYVREQPWGLLALVSRALTRHDADAVALFATHVASALEVAESIGELERTNRELASCYADLARTQEQLVRRERLAALGELAAVVAHEVRNPLGVLFNSIGSLRRILRAAVAGTARADAEALVSMVDEEANRLKRIVSDLLDFAQPNEPQLAAGPVREVLEEAVRAATIASDARVEVSVARDLPPVEMDARFMRQALLNVVLNGLQALPKDGALRVSAWAEGRAGRAGARIDVTDTGPGIPAEIREKIFEPFFTTKASGTGLGLAVVKRIMEAHHGEVAVDSGPGGTTFTLWLPIAHPAHP